MKTLFVKSSQLRALAVIPAMFYHTLILLSKTSGTNAFASRSPSFKVFYDSSNSQHRDQQYHPEQPSRIDKCVELLQSHEQESSMEKLFDLIDVSPTKDKRLHGFSGSENNGIEVQPFSESFLSKARSILAEVHTEELVSSLETRCRASRQHRIENGKDPLGFIGNIDHDTFLTTESYDVCLRATASWMRCVETVMDGTASSSMALTRPPGHHATKTLPNGFCLFNFAAAAAVHALSLPNCNKVSIIDWDVHYGQGVADIVSTYPDIRYVSMHQVPAFPYLGQSKAVVGIHKNIMTIPIAADSTWTCGYELAFTEDLLPFCYDENEWDADLVIVCAGYDALSSDELASCSLVANDYAKMTKLLKEFIEYDKRDGKKRNVGLIFGLEGGYQLRDNVPGGNLADAVLETMKAACS